MCFLVTVIHVWRGEARSLSHEKRGDEAYGARQESQVFERSTGSLYLIRQVIAWLLCIISKISKHWVLLSTVKQSFFQYVLILQFN